MKAPFLTLLSILALASCSKSEPEPASVAPAMPTLSAAATPAANTTAASGLPKAPSASALHPDLLDPSKAKEKAPDLFKAKFTTTKGDFVIEVHRDWSPSAADRFYSLVKMGFYDDTRFFRAIDGFMVQFGISGNPAVSSKWQEQGIPDDVVKQSNKRGFVTFAQRNTPNTRTTQVFINYGDNSRLDASRFVPFGQVVQGMDVVDALYKGYGEGSPMGAGPDQGRIQAEGNAYLDAKFPKLDGIQRAQLEMGK